MESHKAEYAVADSMLGEWTVMGNPCSGEQAEITFHSQSTFVLPVAGTDTYIAMFDRWNKLDLDDSHYVWLPISFKDGKIDIPWRESVTIER